MPEARRCRSRSSTSSSSSRRTTRSTTTSARSPAPRARTTCTKLDGGTIARPHAPDRTPRDLCHAHDCALADWNNGQMNGWDAVDGSTNNGDNLAYAQYHEDDIPNYWAVRAPLHARRSLLREVLGPSFPGHIVRARRAGRLGDRQPRHALPHPYWGCDQDRDARQIDVQDHEHLHDRRRSSRASTSRRVPDVLPAGVDWKFYGIELLRAPRDLVDVQRRSSDPQRPGLGATSSTSSSSTTDIDNDTLPEVSWLVNQDLNDEHPQHRQRLRRRELDGRQPQQADAVRVLEGHRHPLHDGRLRRLVRPRAAAAPVRLRPDARPTASASACRSSSSRRTRSPASSSRRSPSRRASRASSRRCSASSRRFTISIPPRRTRRRTI